MVGEGVGGITTSGVVEELGFSSIGEVAQGKAGDVKCARGAFIGRSFA
jgi:hypothetical protein